MRKTPEFSLFFFSADCAERKDNKYQMLLEAAKFADSHRFAAVWTPERHFQRFGGLYGSPSVTGAALAVVTKHVSIRAGSVVLPLQNPLRVAEEWSMIDNLSNGRVGMSVASGWHVNDFVLSPDTYHNRRGHITLMAHTFVAESEDALERIARPALAEYIKVNIGMQEDHDAGGKQDRGFARLREKEREIMIRAQVNNDVCGPLSFI